MAWAPHHKARASGYAHPPPSGQLDGRVQVHGEEDCQIEADQAGCLLIGYPEAYYISRHTRRTKSLLLALLILPFWVSYLMRMLAWVNLFAPEGYVNGFLRWTQLVPTPPDWLKLPWNFGQTLFASGDVPFKA